ncbi:hypothetical protein AVEN_223002-1 [Araneus ventricosus]|uniref:Uncharacterized protein n=1 Tax=Araneus ventricosus TaxID=182803 RepID=A0A4Y2UIX3_ARAVE|nr:hypothetical protein AVEN_5878-1 [Araneus ventricosus]GBO13022.1 hypothetical protein AVEN_238506-1 [Araneus ventricosus]GBO13023.1 hypothetical protein AVEN_90577-1 [Araneus ventricosus]GBO13025.1 hypothetical protein AVEN_223002-1 [Araneus ventricosus]
MYGGTSVQYGFKPVTLQLRSPDLTTRLPRPPEHNGIYQGWETCGFKAACDLLEFLMRPHELFTICIEICNCLQHKNNYRTITLMILLVQPAAQLPNLMRPFRAKRFPTPGINRASSLLLSFSFYVAQN